MVQSVNAACSFKIQFLVIFCVYEGFFFFSDFRLEKKHIQTCKIIKNNIRYKCNKIGLLDFHTTCIQELTFLR